MKNSYEIRGEVTTVFIRHKGRVLETIIDTDCLAKAMEMPNTWFINDCGYVRANYPSSRKQLASLRLHRFITSAPDNMVVDHINGDRLDNRLVNLRIVTTAQNAQNQKINCSYSRSGIRGVSWFARDSKWRAYVSSGGKQHHLGYFETKEEAARAASEGRRRYQPFSNENLRLVK